MLGDTRIERNVARSDRRFANKFRAFDESARILYTTRDPLRAWLFLSAYDPRRLERRNIKPLLKSLPSIRESFTSRTQLRAE